MMKNIILLILGLSVFSLFIFEIFNAVYFIKSSFSGEVVYQEELDLDKEEKLQLTIDSDSPICRIELKMKIRTVKYHRDEGEYEPDYYYDFQLTQKKNDEIETSESFIISNDQNSKSGSYRNIASYFDGDVYHQSFIVTVKDFKNDGKNTYLLNTKMLKDSVYFSELEQLELTVKKNVKQVNLIQYTLIQLLVSILMLILIGIIIFIIIYPYIFKKGK